ncbi:MAG: IS3 family transposase [Ruminococcus sp.]|nr:IS3 family transposase [Ruminococcus sp.]
MKKYSSITKKEIIEQIKAGGKVTAISKKYGISRQTIYRWLAENADFVEPKRRSYGELERYSQKLENIIEILKYAQPTEKLTQLERYELITELSSKYNVNTLCDALDIPKGSYYNHIFRNKKDKTVYAEHRREITVLVNEIFHESNEIFGAKKIAAIIKEKGYIASPELVRSIMKENGWISIRGGAKKQYEKEKHWRKNILNREFTATRPNEIWVGDVTYYHFKQKNFYICVIMDLYARKVVGYRVSLRNSTQLTKRTFKEAYESRKPDKLLFHSDCGANYTSKSYMSYLSSLGVTQSFSRPGNPYDNSVIESFFKSMKAEELYRTKYRSEYEFRTAITRYINFYNSVRPHKTNGNLTPDKMEEKYYNKK